MIRKYVLPFLALCGVIFAIYTVIVTNRPLPAAQPVVEPALAPFPTYVAGAGIVEASTQNIAIGTPVSGLVTEVLVQIGTRVKAGDPLFKLDGRDLQAERLVRQAALQTAEEHLARLTRLPRPEELPAAEARVREAEAVLADMRTQLSMVERVTDPRAISREERSHRHFAVQTAEAKLAEARAQMALLKAGAWKHDLNIAKAEVATAQAQLQAIDINLERLTVRAPVAGDILQINIRRGEFAPAGALLTPLMLLGHTDRFHVRVDVDEQEAWRIRPQAAAVTFVRGNRALTTPLVFERIEPYIVPKRSLTGESTERVDTRVLQVLYSFPRDALPVYVGQQIDVFIEALPLNTMGVLPESPSARNSPRGTP
jgi:multidrug efflux pump subunit AcrA (membrane-fusion protein)